MSETKILFRAEALYKQYPGVDALAGVDTSFPAGSVLGLVGRNGSGKTTLLHHVTGLVLPSAGRCTTFGTPSDRLGARELERLGVVPQKSRFLDWMTVEQHLEYVASFYPRWDRDRTRRLLAELELPAGRKIAGLSPGNEQKLSIATAVGHHPDLLLLDEPVSARDPIAREEFLGFVLELVRDDGTTVVISSHVLRDVERIVDRVLCLEAGRVVEDGPLDDLLERCAEWIVTSEGGDLPASFPEGFIRAQRGDGRRASLVVEGADALRAGFEAAHGVRVEPRRLNFERIFPLLVGREVRR